MHMTEQIILASGSEIRRDLLRRAGLDIQVMPARIDEDALRGGLVSEGVQPRDVADALAEAKARKISAKEPGALVIGCDQILNLGPEILSKPETPEIARDQLQRLSGQTHMLQSAAVIYQGGEPLWRHVGVVRLRMREISEAYLDDYLARNWESVRHSVGAYKLEEEGVRLFTRIDGDYFTVLGLPMLELLSYLTMRGTLPS